jgi:hypothetical protein
MIFLLQDILASTKSWILYHVIFGCNISENLLTIMLQGQNKLIGATVMVTTAFIYLFSLAKLTSLIELKLFFLHNLIRNLYNFILGNFGVI